MKCGGGIKQKEKEVMGERRMWCKHLLITFPQNWYTYFILSGMSAEAVEMT